MRSVTIKVPATTSNLGPGFDTLGIALSLHNRIQVTRGEHRGVRITSPIADDARAGAVAMLTDAARAYFRVSRTRGFGVDVSLTGDVPIARGLGSSVTARLGVVAGLDQLAGTAMSRQTMLEVVTGLEHHPDNAAPAIFGGFTVAGSAGKSVRCLSCRVSRSISFVTLIPDLEVSTEEARKLVPGAFSKADTIHNLNRAALISAAFISGDYEALKGLFDDRVHQPYRQALIPQLFNVIRAGEKAGAIGGWLSGSGSTIICLTSSNAEKIGSAMRRVIPNSVVKILRAENRGFTIAGGR